MKTMIFIVWWCIQVSIPCNDSDGPITTLMYCYEWDCNNLTAFTERDSAVNYMKQIESSYLFAPKPRLDSMTLDEYIDLNNSTDN